MNLPDLIRALFFRPPGRNRPPERGDGGTGRDRFDGAPASASGGFDADYDTASAIIRRRLNERFPDNYHARSLPGYDPACDYSGRRAEAIDVSSAAVAAALRAGAGIGQAVAAGAKSIGL